MFADPPTEQTASNFGTEHNSKLNMARKSRPGDSTELTLCTADMTREDLSGFVLGQYALGRRIGGGGMGTVYAARHLHLDRGFAVKFVGSDLTNSTEAHLRFEQEVLALGKLQHPNIVNAVDAGCIHGLQYLVTEMLDGDDLAQLVKRRGPIQVSEACELVYQAALGLAHSHRCGFVHRDIKPSNLIVSQSGVVKVLDFGLVRTLEVNLHLTENGEMLGTWDFVAPEQAHDASQVDSRCDIYGLGCTLVFLLSGEVPFGTSRYGTAAAKLRGHLFDTPPWLENPPDTLPPELRDVLLRMLAKSPAQRFSTCDEVAETLAAFLNRSHAPKTPTVVLSAERHVDSSQTILKKPRKWRRPGSLLALLFVLSFIMFFPHPHPQPFGVTPRNPGQDGPLIRPAIRPGPPAFRPRAWPGPRPGLQALPPADSNNAMIPEMEFLPHHPRRRTIPGDL